MTEGKGKAHRGKVPDERIPSSLQEVTAKLSAILRRGNNLGVEFRQFSLRTMPETELLAVFIHGMADDERVRLWAIEPLERVAIQQPRIGRLSPNMLRNILPAPRIRLTDSLPGAIRAILGGGTALFLDGGLEAVLVATQRTTQPAAGPAPGNWHSETFGSELAENLALIRKRLRDPALVAEPRQLSRSRDHAALVYLDGRAESGLIASVGDWLQEKAGGDVLNRGGVTGISGVLGLLPHLMTIRWPDKVAVLLDHGYVAVLVDGLPHAYVAPVTAAAVLSGPGDVNLRRPLAHVLLVLRVLQKSVVLMAPAAVVALMSYHQEMLPTPFLLGMARTRDNALFPILLEVLGLEVLHEVIREAAIRLPFTFGSGTALVAGTLLVMLMVQANLVGPLPAVSTVLVAVASLGLPSYEALYISRVWRFWMIAGAAVFGLYGLATVHFLLLVYLTQARSFQVPFIGETGMRFRSPGRSSSRKGGRLRARG